MRSEIGNPLDLCELHYGNIALCPLVPQERRCSVVAVPSIGDVDASATSTSHLPPGQQAY